MLIGILLFVHIAMILAILPNIEYLFYYLELIIYLLTNIAYLYTALANPGICIESASNYYFKSEDLLTCPTCNIKVSKESKTTHCIYCNICIEEVDHHCPWTGKCIAKHNLYSFYAFVVFVFTYLMFSIICGCMFIINVLENNLNHRK